MKTTLAPQELGVRPAITPIGETSSGAPLAGLTGVDEYGLTSSAYALHSRKLLCRKDQECNLLKIRKPLDVFERLLKIPTVAL